MIDVTEIFITRNDLLFCFIRPLLLYGHIIKQYIDQVVHAVSSYLL